MEQLQSPKKQQEDIYYTLDHDNMENKEALDCPVCLEPYNEGLHSPKMMPCLHTLCASCIASLTSTVTKQNPEPLTESVTSPAPESVFRRAYLRFASQPNLSSTSLSEDTGQGTANHTTTSTITSENRNSIIALANVIQTNRQHPVLRRVAGQRPFPSTWEPQDPQPPPPATSTRPPTASKPRGGLSVSLKRPEVSPPLPPKSGVTSSQLEPQIPKDVVVQCPLCRSEVSTSKLQTNRYVVAHMRDLARLSLYSPCSPSPTFPPPRTEKPASSTQPTSPSFPPEDFWCEDCKQTATDGCTSHEVIPIAEWLETQKATLESLRMAVEDQLGQHTTYLQSLETMIKDVYYSLNKASRFVWQANRQVGDLKEELKCQPPTPTTESPKDMADALMEKVTQLERLAKRVSKQDLTAGNSEVTVSSRQQQLFISTSNPKFALVITAATGRTSV